MSGSALSLPIKRDQAVYSELADNREDDNELLQDDNSTTEVPINHSTSITINLAGTVFDNRDGLWTLGNLVTSTFHFNDYSLVLTEIKNGLNLLDLERYRVRVYRFDDASESVAKFRRRQMKRFSDYEHALFTKTHDGITYIPFFVDPAVESLRVAGRQAEAQQVTTIVTTPILPESSDTEDPQEDESNLSETVHEEESIGWTNEPDAKKEKAKLKQRERRQRKRTEARSVMEKANDEDQPIRSTHSKRHKPTSVERTVNFLIKISDFNHPRATQFFWNNTMWSLLSVQPPSVTNAIRHNVYAQTFPDIAGMERLRNKTSAELALLLKHDANKVHAQHLLSRELVACADADSFSWGESDRIDMTLSKVRYASYVLPRMITGFELQIEAHNDRIKQALQVLKGRHELERPKEERMRIARDSFLGSCNLEFVMQRQGQLTEQLLKIPVQDNEAWESMWEAYKGANKPPG